MAETASLTVAEAGRDLSGGLPRQRSDTTYASKRTAIQRMSALFWERTLETFRERVWRREKSWVVGVRDINVCIDSRLLLGVTTNAH